MTRILIAVILTAAAEGGMLWAVWRNDFVGVCFGLLGVTCGLVAVVTAIELKEPE